MPAMGEEGGDKDPLPSLGGFGVLGIGVHHLPWWGQRSCVAAAPSPTCLPPPLSIAQYIQLHRAGQVTQQPSHPKGEVGVRSSLDNDRQSLPPVHAENRQDGRGPQG